MLKRAEMEREPCVEWVGKQLTFTLKGSGESYKGEVFTYDKATDTLVIKDHTVGLHEADYRFLKGKDVQLPVKLEGSSRVPEPSPALEPETVERYACLFPLVVMRTSPACLRLPEPNCVRSHSGRVCAALVTARTAIGAATALRHSRGPYAVMLRADPQLSVFCTLPRLIRQAHGRLRYKEKESLGKEMAKAVSNSQKVLCVVTFMHSMYWGTDF